MGLLSYLKSAAAPAPAVKPVADAADVVQRLRLRARRRLIGAAVLVGLGVIGFPLVFESQPRPIPIDLPIEIPRKEAAAPLVIPEPAPSPQIAVQAAPDEPVLEAPTRTVVEKHKQLNEKLPAPVRDDSARVQAMLDGKPAEKMASEAMAVVATGRFIVQVGAYADSKAAQDVRLKVEKLGMKTYIQAVETADGRRIRVRVGPFASRDEADRMAAKVAAAGLKTVVFAL